MLLSVQIYETIRMGKAKRVKKVVHGTISGSHPGLLRTSTCSATSLAVTRSGRERAVPKNREARTVVWCRLSVAGGRRTTFPRSPAVSSSRRGLTSLFGMGRGAPPRHSRHLSLYRLAFRPDRMGGSGHKNTTHAPRVNLPPPRGD